MKKITSLIFIMVLSFILVGCDEDTKKEYTVTYKVNEEVYHTQKVKEKDKLKFPDNPKKENYTFEYWVNDGIEFKESQEVLKDLTLTAVFKKKESSYNGKDTAQYYANVKDKKGTELLSSLKTRLYDGATIGAYQSSNWKTLKRADLVDDKSSNVWLIYDGSERSVNKSGGRQGDWNKEHVVAKSWIEKIGAKNNTGDQHNLRAADVKINSDRGNKRFSEGNGSFKNNSGSFYPGDEHKGDVARIIMYMLVMLPNLDINQIFEASNGYEILLKWHTEDPVNNFELRRNDIIHEDQGNRNPFIDHPEYANLIWGKDNKTAQTTAPYINYQVIKTTPYLPNKKQFVA